MKRKYIPPVLLIVIAYLLIVPFLGMFVFTHDAVMLLFQYVYNPAIICFLFALIWNLLWPLLTQWDTQEITRWNLRIKLVLIPFYGFTVFFGIGVPLAIAFLFLIDAVLMLTTSVYGLKALAQAKKEGRLGKWMFFILFLCHLCFAADVVAAWVLHRKLRV